MDNRQLINEEQGYRVKFVKAYLEKRKSVII